MLMPYTNFVGSGSIFEYANISLSFGLEHSQLAGLFKGGG